MAKGKTEGGYGDVAGDIRIAGDLPKEVRNAIETTFVSISFLYFFACLYASKLVLQNVHRLGLPTMRR